MEFRDYSKFFTRLETAKFMVSLLQPIKAGYRYLEPSAGDGVLVKELMSYGVFVTAIELNPHHKEELSDCASFVYIGDFLTIRLNPVYNGVIANPPFGNGVDLQAHFDKMLRVILPGGRLVCLVPADFSPDIEYHSYPLENWGTNKDGTVTRIKIIVIDKK